MKRKYQIDAALLSDKFEEIIRKRFQQNGLEREEFEIEVSSIETFYETIWFMKIYFDDVLVAENWSTGSTSAFPTSIRGSLVMKRLAQQARVNVDVYWSRLLNQAA